MTSTERPFVSIVIPCRNESSYISLCIDSILANDYPKDKYEVIIVDGLSTDVTREIIESYIKSNPNIRLLDNPGKTTPRAFNLGIQNSMGEYILILNAHSTYPQSYISRTVDLYLGNDVANAGGRLINVPNGDGPWASPIAYVTGHRFGVGNGAFRINNNSGSYVDTVAFGFYRKSIFNEIGLFDERLTRNQDNELNDRLRKAGYKIILDPAIEIYYKNQANLFGLAHQGFYTGMWNVYTFKLFPYTFKWRRFVPAAFVAYLLSLPAIVFFIPRGGYYILPAVLYLGLNLSISVGAEHPLPVRARISATFFSYHLAYGFGTWLGVINVITGRWRGHLGKPLRK